MLIQEMANTLSENGMDQPPGSDGITLEDLEDVNITTPANPSWLRWNGTEWQDQPILEDGDAWVADDNHVVTSAAGDDRWLNATINVIGGDGIEVTEAGGNVTIAVDLDDVSGLEFDSGELRVDANNGLTIDANGLDVSGNQTEHWYCPVLVLRGHSQPLLVLVVKFFLLTVSIPPVGLTTAPVVVVLPMK